MYETIDVRILKLETSGVFIKDARSGLRTADEEMSKERDVE